MTLAPSAFEVRASVAGALIHCQDSRDVAPAHYRSLGMRENTYLTAAIILTGLLLVVGLVQTIQSMAIR